MNINRLSASQCKVKGKRTQLCDGMGLWFHRLDIGAGAYFSYRYRSPVTGKDRSYGIGLAHIFGLQQTREAAADAARAEGERTFQKVAEEYVAAHTEYRRDISFGDG